MMDAKKLRELAEAVKDDGFSNSPQMWAYVEAMSPPTALELLDKLDAAEQALAGEKEEAEKQRRGSEWAHALLQERTAQWSVDYLRLSQKIADEKARVDIAERRSIAAGAQVEELQAQIIDLNIYHRKATKELVERLQRSYEDGVIIGRHNDDLTAALRKAEARIEKLREALHDIDQDWVGNGHMAKHALKADDAASK